MPLTTRQITDYCQDLLPTVLDRVRVNQGDNAEEFAGEALHKALTLYDPAAGRTVEHWVLYKVPLLVIELIRTRDGRRGTGRYDIHHGNCSLEDFDQDDEAAVIDTSSDELAATLRKMADFTGMDRWIVWGRFFGSFTDTDLAKVLNVRPRLLRARMSAIQQSVRDDRRPVAVRCPIGATCE